VRRKQIFQKRVESGRDLPGPLYELATNPGDRKTQYGKERETFVGKLYNKSGAKGRQRHISKKVILRLPLNRI